MCSAAGKWRRGEIVIRRTLHLNSNSTRGPPAQPAFIAICNHTQICHDICRDPRHAANSVYPELHVSYSPQFQKVHWTMNNEQNHWHCSVFIFSNGPVILHTEKTLLSVFILAPFITIRLLLSLKMSFLKTNICFNSPRPNEHCD